MNNIPEKTEEEQQFHAQMLADCYDIMFELKTYPILSQGALLGAYKIGDFFPWARGAVIIVESSKAMQVGDIAIKRLTEKGFKIKRYFKKEKNWKIRADKGRLNIEIAGYYRKGDVWERNTGSRIKTIPVHFFDELDTIELRGKKYVCPKDIEGYLSHLYKDWREDFKGPHMENHRSEEHTKKI